MTYYDLWMGPPDRLDPPLDVFQQGERLRDGDVTFWDGNPAYFGLRDKIAAGAVQGQQMDWGSYAALMKREDIEAFLADIYGPPGDYEAQHACLGEHLADRMRSVRAFVAELPSDTWVAVLVSEF